MSKSTLSSVVSNLVRASMGASIASTVQDDDLDRHVAELILKEAKQKAEKYAQHGIRAYLPAESADANVPKTNKRFLSSIIRNTDEHNKTILRAQAIAAQEARTERLEQEKKERRARAEEAVEAERLRRSKGRSGRRDDDREERRERKRRERSWERREDEHSDYGGRKGKERAVDKDEKPRRHHRSRSRHRDERDHHRRRRHGQSRERSESPRRRTGEDEGEDEYRSRRRDSHRHSRKHSRRSTSRDRQRGLPKDSHDEEQTHRSSRRRRRRTRSPPRLDEDEDASSHSRARQRTTRRTPSFTPSADSYRSAEGLGRKKRKSDEDLLMAPEKHARSRSPSRPRSVEHLQPREADEVRPEGMDRDSSQEREDTSVPDEFRTVGSLVPSRSDTPKVAAKALDTPKASSSRAAPSPRGASPSPGPPLPPPTPSSKSSRHRSRSSKVAPPPPAHSPPPLPSHLPSKMDRYFEESYDPRLDVAPLSMPTIPSTGLISDAEFAGWDAMLEIIKQRREDKEDRKRLERWGVGKDKDKDKEKEKDKKKKGVEVPSETIDVMSIEYKKRGSVREWDLGKEGF